MGYGLTSSIPVERINEQNVIGRRYTLDTCFLLVVDDETDELDLTHVSFSPIHAWWYTSMSCDSTTSAPKTSESSAATAALSFGELLPVAGSSWKGSLSRPSFHPTAVISCGHFVGGGCCARKQMPLRSTICVLIQYM